MIEKIRKAAEARDKAIHMSEQNGNCAPCGEPTDACMCESFESMVESEIKEEEIEMCKFRATKCKGEATTTNKWGIPMCEVCFRIWKYHQS